MPTRDGPTLGDYNAQQLKIGAKDPHASPLLTRRRPTGNLKPMRFVSLHHHSTFSYLDGYQLPEAHVRRATELNMGAMAMTEHGNKDSHAKFDKAAEEQGVKPIFGCEVYMPVGPDALGRDRDDAGSWQTQRKHHLTILAKTPEGMANLNQLITKSWQSFYFEPTVTMSDLIAHQKGLIILSGCQGSLLFCSTVGGKGIEEEDASYRRGLAVARFFSKTFDDYYIEVQAFPELEQTRRFNRLAGRIARAVRRRLVATMDCHYTLLEESEVQKILHNLRPGEKRTLEEQAREWGYAAPLCPPPNDNTIYRRLTASGLSRDEAIEAIVSTEEIAQACTATLPKLPMIRFPVPAGYEDVIAYWREELRKGWKLRGLDGRPGPERARYKRQLRHEMELIESKDFVDYFMLIQAGIVYLKDVHGVPIGPARGSGGASIAAWLLRITEVDPLRPELMGLLKFERFIDVTRVDLPDFDIDVPSEARPILRDFYEGMFGPGCVNNVGTWTIFKNKLAVDDVARVFNVPKRDVETLKDFLIERSSGDLRASSTIEDTAEQFPAAAEVFEKWPDLKKAAWLEGNAKGFGVHAAALVLSNEPITSVTAVAEREVPKGSGNVVQVVAVDKYDAERQGMVKMDFLGLNTMTVLWDCCERVGMSINELYDLPLDDPKVYDRFREVDVTGVFQFEGRAQRYVCASLLPERFSEIMDCTALARPGPLHNGAAKTYAEIKWGGRAPESLHPALDAITEPTQYQIVYQEQILSIARLIGGFDARGVAEIRKIISLKKGEQEFNRRKEEFLKGCETLHERSPEFPPMDRETGEAIWGNMITSGAYAFNAAHCAGYGLIAVWTMWFKVYHPDVFYAAQLAEAAGNNERHRYLLRDAEKHGVRILLPSLRRSERNWSPVRRGSEEGTIPNIIKVRAASEGWDVGDTYRVGGRALSPPTIRAGFRQVEGIGEKTAGVVDRWRNEESPEGWGELQRMRGFGPKTIIKITDWMKSDDPFKAFKLDRDIEEVRGMLRDGKLGELPAPTHTAQDLAAEQSQGKTIQCFWLGTFVKRNIRDIFEQNRARGEELNPASVKDPHLSEWALLTGEDETDQLLITVDRWKYPVFKDAIFNFRMGQDLLLIRAVKPGRSAVRKLNVKQLWVIDPDDD